MTNVLQTPRSAGVFPAVHEEECDWKPAAPSGIEERVGQFSRTDRRETYHRFMDAAESVFIRFGYEGASIRMISREAEAPLGTLHHYWGSKEVLFRETCERRFATVLAKQAERLADCERRLDAGEGVAAESVLRALIEPPVLGDGDAADGSAADATRNLYGRVITEPSEVVRRIVRDLFHGPALQRRINE
ncbi:TetR/AcrR family transcriptional regulator [bacterium]|nr:MAG: TetR/AcrR family transcriptional regulator [bacterium]